MEKVCGNILKHSLLKEFSQHSVVTDNQLKLRILRKNKDELFTVKTGEHIPIGLR